MTPFYADDWLTIYEGDCREILAGLPSDSVDCVVTSPPYWGLRDYGTEGQLGLERTPEEYVANMVAVFREVRRVLKPSGTCWLNLGDSYSSGGERTTGRNDAVRQGKQTGGGFEAGPRVSIGRDGLKPKDLVGIPWRVAFALQADGWYLRSDIIWAKPNPMPESVTDRPTKSHEYLFLLTKSARYYFDADAVRETPAEYERKGGTATWAEDSGHTNGKGSSTFHQMSSAGRNIRSVWTIATRPYPGAHFAVFPPELPERCIKAGSSEKGVCPECGAPWERVVERIGAVKNIDYADEKRSAMQQGGKGSTTLNGIPATSITTGWRDDCRCRIADPVPAVILDPFAGSGTVGLVANRLSRRAILIDLNPEYLKQQMKRNAQTPLGLSEGVA